MTVKARDEEAVYDLLTQSAGTLPIARGIMETVRMLERRRARTVLIATNVEPRERLNVVRSLCEQNDVPVISVSDRMRLGRAVGLDVPASCVALPIRLSV